MLINNEQKLQAVKYHIVHGHTIAETSKQFKLDPSKIKYYVKLFKMHGEDPFINRDKKYIYTRELKLKAINEYITGQKSQGQISIELGLISQHILTDWVKKFHNEGEAAILTTYGRPNYQLEEEKKEKIANKELLERLQYLEAENETLKKYVALTQEKKRIIK